METQPGPPTDVVSVMARLHRPKRMVVTAGMPYANGPLHLATWRARTCRRTSTPGIPAC
jgi:hypothetical protein